MPFGPRQLLEHRISEISTELELLFEGACDHARREQAEQLNQAVRRLRIAPDPGELLRLLPPRVVARTLEQEFEFGGDSRYAFFEKLARAKRHC